MKYFIQYLDKGAVSGKFIEPCGDRAVIKLDGRLTPENMIKTARENNGVRRPLYPHFRIYKGDFRAARSVFTTVPGENVGIYSGY